jgi:hypothetical protein
MSEGSAQGLIMSLARLTETEGHLLYGMRLANDIALADPNFSDSTTRAVRRDRETMIKASNDVLEKLAKALNLELSKAVTPEERV